MVALLAPIPEEHLISALEVLREREKVAFGSRAWEVFRELDKMIGGGSVDVFIFASHASFSQSPPRVSWRAKYLGHQLAKGGAYPGGDSFRPKSTFKYPGDNKGYWAVFWEVCDLIQLPTIQQIKIGDLGGYGKAKPYVKHFIPEGPILIKVPKTETVVAA